jgi:hypothetical protein
MANLRIFRPARNAMQSGRSNTRQWVAEFEPGARKEPDALMGWNGSNDTRSQVRLSFSTKDEAIAYAERQGHHYTVHEPGAAPALKPKTYADNFRFDKVGGSAV